MTDSGEQSGVTLTIRLVRSFEHRNVRPVVYKNIPLSQTASSFIQFILSDLPNRTGLPPPFKKYSYDTLKIEHKPHGCKTSDPVINTERDEELILKKDCTLTEAGVGNETELSLFKLEDYLKYKDNPSTVWRAS